MFNVGGSVWRKVSVEEKVVYWNWDKRGGTIIAPVTKWYHRRGCGEGKGMRWWRGRGASFQEGVISGEWDRSFSIWKYV